jgi:hypothetical protein
MLVLVQNLTNPKKMTQSCNPLFVDTQVQMIYKHMLRRDYTQVAHGISDLMILTKKLRAPIYFEFARMQHDLAHGNFNQVHDRLRDIHYHIISPLLFMNEMSNHEHVFGMNAYVQH